LISEAEARESSGQEELSGKNTVFIDPKQKQIASYLTGGSNIIQSLTEIKIDVVDNGIFDNIALIMYHDKSISKILKIKAKTAKFMS
jgi:hypothetical protein